MSFGDKFWRQALEGVADPFVIVDAEGSLIAANKPARRFIYQHRADLEAFMADGGFDRLTRVSRGLGAPVPVSIELANRKGKVRGLCLRLGDARCEGFALQMTPDVRNKFFTLTDKIRSLQLEIRERIKAQKAAEEAAAFNKLLLNELRHRVGNNIQMLASLLQRQAASADEAAKALIAKAVERLYAMSAAHKMMYRAENLEYAAAATFFPALVEEIAKSLKLENSIRLDIRSNWKIANQEAAPLALILNETITNAAKYGAADGGVNISVALTDEEGANVLVVRDHGPGFPAFVDAGAGLGFNLVDGLAAQLGGTVERSNDNGAVTRISIPAAAQMAPTPW